MMSRISLSNLPDPGKVEFVVDGHAAFGNSTDPNSAASGFSREAPHAGLFSPITEQ